MESKAGRAGRNGVESSAKTSMCAPASGWHLLHGGHGVEGRVVPGDVADVGLVHHVVPFAVEERVVVVGGECGVLGEEVAGLVGVLVGAGASLAGVEMVASCGDVHLRDDG